MGAGDGSSELGGAEDREKVCNSEFNRMRMR